MKVRFLHDWREVNRGDVRDMSEFDVIRLQDLGVIAKLHRSEMDGANRRFTLHSPMPAQADNSEQNQHLRSDR